MTTGAIHALRIPASLRHDVEQIFTLTDPFCAEYLDTEYGELVRKLIAKLARKRPSPLARGDLRIWAAAAIYTVGSVNFLFDRAQRPHLTGDNLSALTGVPKSTLANKAKLIRDVSSHWTVRGGVLTAGADRIQSDGLDALGRGLHCRRANPAARGAGGGQTPRAHPECPCRNEVRRDRDHDEGTKHRVEPARAVRRQIVACATGPQRRASARPRAPISSWSSSARSLRRFVVGTIGPNSFGHTTSAPLHHQSPKIDEHAPGFAPDRADCAREFPNDFHQQGGGPDRF